LSVNGYITEKEYDAGVRWRSIYYQWLNSIGAPDPHSGKMHLEANESSRADLVVSMSDERAESVAKSFKMWADVLKRLGPRVFHAVNAIAVYEEPEELGDFKFTAHAAKKGLAALAARFG
jgi:hypothetical protein